MLASVPIPPLPPRHLQVTFRLAPLWMRFWRLCVTQLRKEGPQRDVNPSELHVPLL